MIRVAIAEDHAMVREGLSRLLAQSGKVEVVGEASDGAEAVALVEREKPDVILLDITMPKKDGIEATGDIAALDVDTKVLILSMHSDQQYVLRTFRAGAHGFIGKQAVLEDLIDAIETVHNGERYLPKELEAVFADNYLAKKLDRSPAEILSRREFQVLNFLASGMTNREIAGRLEISVKTVDTHRGHVLKKLNLRNNSDITRFAIQHGFITC